MIKTTLSIDGMMCSMCEVHICDTIRIAVPKAKKVCASRHRKEASFLSEEPVDEKALIAAVNETGYTCTGIESENYMKKGWFSR